MQRETFAFSSVGLCGAVFHCAFSIVGLCSDFHSGVGVTPGAVVTGFAAVKHRTSPN
jgi:hypothetical protein